MPTLASARGPARAALRLRHLAEAGVLGGLSLAAGAAPVSVLRAIGSAVGTVWWAVDGRHRRTALENVRLAFGGALPPGEARRLVRRSIRHLAQVTVDMLAAERYLAEDLAARVRIEGLEHLRAAHARGKGVIGVTGHLGQWEYLALTWARLGVPLAVIARPLDNPYLEARLVRLRTANGNSVIDKRRGFRQALSVLRAGGGVGILIDQRPKRGGLEVPFFGASAHTTEGLAGLALRSEAAVVPVFMLREPDGTWRLAFEPEVEVPRTGDSGADALRLTAECTAILEKWIRRYPDQWLWTHRRWAAPRFGSGRGRGEPPGHDG